MLLELSYNFDDEDNNAHVKTNEEFVYNFIILVYYYMLVKYSKCITSKNIGTPQTSCMMSLYWTILINM